MKWDGKLTAGLLVAGALFLGVCGGYHLNSLQWDRPWRVGTEQAVESASLLPIAVPEETSLPEETSAPASTVQTAAPTEQPTEEEGGETAVPEGSKAVSEEKININTADLETLMELDGIGEVKAQAIIDDREANGPFRYPEDLTRVSGIGEKTLEKNLDRITTESEENP